MVRSQVVGTVVNGSSNKTTQLRRMSSFTVDIVSADNVAPCGLTLIAVRRHRRNVMQPAGHRLVQRRLAHIHVTITSTTADDRRFNTQSLVCTWRAGS